MFQVGIFLRALRPVLSVLRPARLTQSSVRKKKKNYVWNPSFPFPRPTAWLTSSVYFGLNSELSFLGKFGRRHLPCCPVQTLILKGFPPSATQGTCYCVRKKINTSTTRLLVLSVCIVSMFSMLTTRHVNSMYLSGSLKVIENNYQKKKKKKKKATFIVNKSHFPS